MDIRLLRYFLAVVNEGGILRAAETLHITQPTLSRQMMQLESELGAKLFERGKRIELTEAGMMLHRRAEEIVQLADKMKDELANHEALTGTVSIGCGAFMPSLMLPEIMRSFREKYPRVSYEFYTNSADYIRERLDHGTLDFGFLLEPVDVEKYDYFRLNETVSWGLLMRKDNPLSGKKFIAREDILSVPLITAGRITMQKEISNWLGDDISRLKIFAVYNIVTNAAFMVKEGLACALTLDRAAQLFEGDTLTFRPLEPELRMSSVLVWKKLDSFAGVAGKFLEHFKNMYFGHENI